MSFEKASAIHYTEGEGASSKQIRLMAGLLLLKGLRESPDTRWLAWQRGVGRYGSY